MQLSDSEIALVDLSARSRSGMKGSHLTQWLDSNGYRVGADSNRAYEQPDGILIARLSPGELLLLSDSSRSSVSSRQSTTAIFRSSTGQPASSRRST